MSARLLPEDERWKTGWLGRPGARDMREPEVERAWLEVNRLPVCCMLDMEFERFIAEVGIGIAEALCVTGPRVSRGRRTEKMPVSWAIAW